VKRERARTCIWIHFASNCWWLVNDVESNAGSDKEVGYKDDATNCHGARKLDSLDLEIQ
jgi:hypothetical protein